MKRTYLIEDHRNFFAPTSYQVLDLDSGKVMYTFECDSWGTGNWIVLKYDPIQGKSFQVATIDREVPPAVKVDSSRSQDAVFLSWWWFGTPRFNIKTWDGTQAYFETSNMSAFDGPHDILKSIFTRNTTYYLQTTNKQMETLTFQDATQGFWAKSELSIARESADSPLSRLVDTTHCCGKTTFSSTFEDFQDEDYRIIFLSACVLIQYSLTEDALRLKTTGGLKSQ